MIMTSGSRKQDKNAEAIASAPGDEWLEHPRVNQVKGTHLKLLGLVPLRGRLILDAGCGPGTYGIMLAEGGNNVIGCDISLESTQAARGRATRKKVRFSPLGR